MNNCNMSDYSVAVFFLFENGDKLSLSMINKSGAEHLIELSCISIVGGSNGAKWLSQFNQSFNDHVDHTIVGIDQFILPE